MSEVEHKACGLRLQARSPIAGPAMLMHDRCDVNTIRPNFVQNCERKPEHETLANVCSLDRTCLRKLFDPVGCLFHCRGSLNRSLAISPHRIALTRSFPRALRDGRSQSSLQSFTRGSKGFVRINALNFPTPKFLKSTFSFRKPQFFCTDFDLVVNRRNQTLRELNPIPQREFHCVGGELI